MLIYCIRLELCQHGVRAAVWVDQRAASPHCRSTPAYTDPPTTEAYTYSLAPVGRAWYVQLQGGIPDQLSPFEFGNSTTRKVIATMTLLGHHAKTLHSAYPPTSLPSASIRSLHRRRLSLVCTTSSTVNMGLKEHCRKSRAGNMTGERYILLENS